MTRLVYILAASHSGSTLLAMLLGRHPEVCSVGELKATWISQGERYRCSCGKLILECPFWIGVADRMKKRGFPGYRVTDARTDFSSGMSALRAATAAALAPRSGTRAVARHRLVSLLSWRLGAAGDPAPQCRARCVSAPAFGKGGPSRLLENRHQAQVPAAQPGTGHPRRQVGAGRQGRRADAIPTRPTLPMLVTQPSQRWHRCD